MLRRFEGTYRHNTPMLMKAKYERFEVFTAMPMKNDVFWDVTPYGSCKNRSFGGTNRFHHQGDNNWRAKNVSSKQ
jgi:hypothetical protein